MAPAQPLVDIDAVVVEHNLAIGFQQDHQVRADTSGAGHPKQQETGLGFIAYLVLHVDQEPAVDNLGRDGVRARGGCEACRYVYSRCERRHDVLEESLLVLV